MASGVSPDSTEDPPGQGAPEIPPPPPPLLLDVDFGFVSERYLFFTQRPLLRWDTYRNPLRMVLVTASLLPFLTTATTDAPVLGSVRTFRSVVAYFLPVILSFRIGAIVSEAELLGLGIAARLTGGRALRRLSSCSRALVSLGDESTDAVEAGAGYATWASSPGITAPATPTPNAVMTIAGTAILTARAASGGRIALRGRGLDTCSHSPEQNETKALSPAGV
jgi:hypothetical protein